MILSVILMHTIIRNLQTVPGNVYSGGGKPFPSTSSTQALEYLGRALGFIEKWLQYFETNYSNRNTMYYAKI